jgi:hypothetical protein
MDRALATRFVSAALADDVVVVEQASCDPDGFYLDLWESEQLEEHLRN